MHIHTLCIFKGENVATKTEIVDVERFSLSHSLHYLCVHILRGVGRFLKQRVRYYYYIAVKLLHGGNITVKTVAETVARDYFVLHRHGWPSVSIRLTKCLIVIVFLRNRNIP